MKIFAGIATVVLFAGCARKAPADITPESCAKKAVSRISSWCMAAERGLCAKTNGIFRQSVDVGALRSLCEFYEHDLSLRYECSVPLAVKIEENPSLKESNMKRLRDVRGNPDGSFEMTSLLLGRKEGLHRNRMYLVVDRGDCTMVCSRHAGGIYADSIIYSPGGEIPEGVMRVYEFARLGLWPVFLGDRTYNMKMFMENSRKGMARLYWDCGIWKGIPEGIHVFKRSDFEKWLPRAVDLIPLNIVFSSSNAIIYAPGKMTSLADEERLHLP